MPALPLLLLRFKRLITGAGRESLILYYACRHPATPRSIKVMAILMAIYLVSPVDAISDLLPLLGWVDDLMVLTVGIPWLLRRLPPRVLDDASEQADALLGRRARKAAAAAAAGTGAGAGAGRRADRGQHASGDRGTRRASPRTTPSGQSERPAPGRRRLKAPDS